MPRVLRNYEYENFSYLLEEFNSNKSEPTELHSEEFTLRIERENSEQGIISEKEKARRKRSSLLSDLTNRFVYDENDQIIHDRDSECIKKIKDRDFRMLKDVDANSKPCEACKREIYVSRMIGDDGKRVNHYLHFLRAAGCDLSTLRKMSIQCNKKIHI